MLSPQPSCVAVESKQHLYFDCEHIAQLQMEVFSTWAIYRLRLEKNCICYCSRRPGWSEPSFAWNKFSTLWWFQPSTSSTPRMVHTFGATKMRALSSKGAGLDATQELFGYLFRTCDHCFGCSTDKSMLKCNPIQVLVGRLCSVQCGGDRMVNTVPQARHSLVLLWDQETAKGTVNKQQYIFLTPRGLSAWLPCI